MWKTLLILVTFLVAMSLIFTACESKPIPFPPPMSQETPTETHATTTTPTPTPPSASTPTLTHTPTSAPTPSPTPASVIYSVNQNVEVGKARWKLLTAIDKGSVLKGTESRYPSITKDKTTQGKFIEITLEIENIGTITETWWSEPNLIDMQIREFKPVSDVYEWIPEEKWSAMKELQPNISQQFIWIYEVPKDAVGLKVKVGDISFGGTAQALINLGL